MRYPAKVAMITTGPGVISPIATASTNCASVSQPYSSTRPSWRNGTIASPEPNVNAPALMKKSVSVPSDPPAPIHANPFTTKSGNGEAAAAAPRERRGIPPP